ncbi:MAG TPA: AIR synthase-related protein, partial [Candidatus Mcinerneyibacterium sp.]|nr:AIR synthase-related protein [Candidatus Mcinerneyibacterium sp.]
NEIITGKKIASDDVIIGLKSSGIHSNGFSLVRKVLIDEKNPDKDLIDKLLTPTRIYVKPVLNLKEKIKIKGMVHVTGGGFYENIPRILPDNLDAIINKGSWDIPEIFKKIQEAGGINEKEMFRTFNMGIGYIIVVKENDKEEALDILSDSGENPVLLGKIITGKNQVNFN